MKLKRALISVTDKSGIVEFARGLRAYDIEIISTGGTAKSLRDNNIPVKEVSDLTGFPEMLDGRVKTLHPFIHGGILARRNKKTHKEQVEEHKISLIDLVVVNLYPFEQVIAKENFTFEEAIENIDIGGPAMVRSACKNFESVGVVVDPSDYDLILRELKRRNVTLNKSIKFYLARKAFALTSSYDASIAAYLNSIRLDNTMPEKYPEKLTIGLIKVQDLRYGENPHQNAAFYKETRHSSFPAISNAKQMQGKELSFNNIIDLDAALTLVIEFDQYAAVVIKHTNPCGVAISDVSLLDAYAKAKETDPVSAFGGIIGFNREVDEETAKEVSKLFTEAIVAPSYSDGAIRVFESKKNLRLIQVPMDIKTSDNVQNGYDIKKVGGGVLIQDRDTKNFDPMSLKYPTKRKPTQDEMEALKFAWKVAKYVKSNAIVYARKGQTVGIGAGQMSRVDSSKIAVMKANLPTKGTVLASDAFFPFRDGIDEAAKAGVTAVIQPGGSVKDEEVINACDEYNIAMVFTGIRHFRH
ncbi:MAG: bifunctional phosphoribosylaminoimidazolecarboxamide formyltransferase/IMP cyclohydrolase, partial [Candidatus Schekmanbacteria bacterium RBG_16_38_10]